MTDSSGTVVWSADYKPFGEATVNSSSTITNNLRFPGQYYDAETGLNYNMYRDYNPVIGRFIEADPVGLRQGTNHLYSYTDNNSVNRTDEKGLKWVWNCKARIDSGGWQRNIVAGLFPIFGHCYIKFGNDARGFYTGLPNDHWTAMQEQEEMLLINRICLPSWVSDCEYDCLKEKTTPGSMGAPNGGDVLSNNCCTNLDTVKKECTKKCNCGKS